MRNPVHLPTSDAALAARKTPRRARVSALPASALAPSALLVGFIAASIGLALIRAWAAGWAL